MSVAVIKLGGSVLTGLDAYRRAAAALRACLASEQAERAKLVVVVSAQFGVTDQDLALARSIALDPDPRALDLLWSAGEQRSVALLTFALQREGIAAVGLNVHETGLRLPGGQRPGAGGQEIEVNALRVKAALADDPVAVVPGFLARGAGDRIVSLGRGGSDLTAVLLAISLEAARCELVKDVPGYFTKDPAVHPDARRLPALTYAEALAKEAAGCGLVQRAAIEAARKARLPLVIRSLDPADGHTLLTARPREWDEEEQAVGVGPCAKNQRAERVLGAFSPREARSRRARASGGGALRAGSKVVGAGGGARP